MSKDPNAVALGSKGGKARAKKWKGSEEARATAKKAAAARWKDHPKK